MTSTYTGSLPFRLQLLIYLPVLFITQGIKIHATIKRKRGEASVQVFMRLFYLQTNGGRETIKRRKRARSTSTPFLPRLQNCIFISRYIVPLDRLAPLMGGGQLLPNISRKMEFIPWPSRVGGCSAHHRPIRKAGAKRETALDQHAPPPSDSEPGNYIVSFGSHSGSKK